MENTYLVYILHNEHGEIMAVDSSAFLANTDGWIQIDEGSGERFFYAQGRYFEKSLTDDNGVFRYVYHYERDGHWIEERTDEEMAELFDPYVPKSSDAERIAQLEEELKAAKILLGLEG